MTDTKQPSLADLQPGIYALTEDLANPAPDRRQTDNWLALPVWKAGTKFIVFEQTWPLDGGRSLRVRSVGAKSRWFRLYNISQVLSVIDADGNETMKSPETPRIDGRRHIGERPEQALAAMLPVLVEALAPSTDSDDAYDWIWLSHNGDDFGEQVLRMLWKEGKVDTATILDAIKRWEAS